MIGFLITILVFMLIVALIFYVARTLGAPQPWINIAAAIVGVIFLIWLIYALVPLIGSGGFGHPLVR
jgi:bacteriorhodopsin